MQPIQYSTQSERARPMLQLQESQAYPFTELLPKFAWTQRWLKGRQYALMLERMTEYCNKFGLAMYGVNQHPNQIYQKPQNGIIYFIKGKSLKDLGFPRTQHKKRYCWKKMNFPTELPKTSTFKSGGEDTEQNPSFRMHAVLPLKVSGQYLLCHIRRVSFKEDDSLKQQEQKQLEGCFNDAQPDFYRLFLYIHNTYHLKMK